MSIEMYRIDIAFDHIGTVSVNSTQNIGNIEQIHKS